MPEAGVETKRERVQNRLFFTRRFVTVRLPLTSPLGASCIGTQPRLEAADLSPSEFARHLIGLKVRELS